MRKKGGQDHDQLTRNTCHPFPAFPTLIPQTDAEAEAPILWLPDAKNWLTGKDPDTKKDWRQEEKGMAEDEMVGWHNQLDGQEFEQAPGFGGG